MRHILSKGRLAGLAAALSAAALPPFAHAFTLLPECATTSNRDLAGNCTVGDIIAVFTNLAEILLGIMGSVALGFFVYGGFVWILSGGSSDKVQKGKDILRNSVIGIAIILLSGTIVRLTTTALTGGRSRVPVVGESCTQDPTTNKSVSAGLIVSIPAGIVNDQPVPQQIRCVPKDKSGTDRKEWCGGLNDIYEERGRGRPFTCVNISTEGATGCVRGICTNAPAEFACCIVRPAS